RRVPPRRAPYPPRRGRRRAGRSLPGLGRLHRGVRRGPDHRHAGRRVQHRGHRDRRRDRRTAAGRRDAVRRLPRSGVRADRERGGADALPLGPADVKREGADITVYAYGIALHHALAAAERLAADGVQATVVDVRSLRPLDAETVLREARKTGKCLIVYEDNRLFGAGAEIAALIAEEAFEDLDAPVMRLGGPEIPAMPLNKPPEDWFMPSPEKIAVKMRELAAY